MPTRKQRRRRAKEQRHEYVWEDAEGNELDSPNGAPSKTQSGPRSVQTRGGRVAQPPSWRKSLKRGGIFAPIMLGTVMLLSHKLTLTQQITQTLFIVAVFIPFSYFLDGVFYRSAKKRSARHDQPDGKRGS